MPLNRNTLMRIRTIDSCLQRRQRRWTLEDLRQACEDALYDYEGISSISIRTIQRDIELMRGDKLGYFAPIVVRDKKYYEYEDPYYSITRRPLSKEDLAELSSALDIVKHYGSFQVMHGQEDILARMQDQLQAQESRQQIVYIETNTRLKGLSFLNCLYKHIIHKEPIVVDYKSFKSVHSSRQYLSPYILKEFNNRWFLLGYCPRRHDIMTLALDRIIAVNKDNDGRYHENTYFQPEEYLNSMVGVTRDMSSQTEHVIIRIDANQAPYVLTKPFHLSQQIVEQHTGGAITVSLDVIINFEIERLLLGYGNHIEVLAPKSLRARIAEQVRGMMGKYNS